MKTLAILGASGFVGSTLVERLLEDGRFHIRPLIHSSGNAWRLARLGIDLTATNVLELSELQSSLSGCDLVVNCSRGSSEVMVNGLKNVLQVCRRNRIERFVHISSTAVFGERFSTPQVDESHPINAAPDSYGGKKARQDRLVQKAARNGLPAVILCPPNITGPYSIYLQELVQTLRTRQLALVEGGRMRCSAVDVRNLVRAIECALEAPVTDGRRIIISDPEPSTWSELVNSLKDLAEASDLASIELEQAERLAAPPRKPRKSMTKAVKRVISSEVRAALRKDPTWDWLHGSAVGAARRLPRKVQTWLKNDNGANGRVSKGSSQPTWNTRLIAQQLRNVQFTSSEASTVLGYQPRVSFEESQQDFCNWYRTLFGLDTPYADLLQLL